MNVLKSKIVVRVEFKLCYCAVQLFFKLLPVFSKRSFQDIFHVVICHIKNFFLHKFLHSVVMKPLETVLHCLVSVGAALVLKINLRVAALFLLVVKLRDKKRDKAVERVFLVRDVVVPQNLLKLVHDFCVARKVSKIFLFERKHADVVSDSVIVENYVAQEFLLVSLFPDFKKRLCVCGILVKLILCVVFLVF